MDLVDLQKDAYLLAYKQIINKTLPVSVRKEYLTLNNLITNFLKYCYIYQTNLPLDEGNKKEEQIIYQHLIKLAKAALEANLDEQIIIMEEFTNLTNKVKNILATKKDHFLTEVKNSHLKIKELEKAISKQLNLLDNNGYDLNYLHNLTIKNYQAIEVIDPYLDTELVNIIAKSLNQTLNLYLNAYDAIYIFAKKIITLYEQKSLPDIHNLDTEKIQIIMDFIKYYELKLQNEFPTYAIHLDDYYKTLITINKWLEDDYLDYKALKNGLDGISPLASVLASDGYKTKMLKWSQKKLGIRAEETVRSSRPKSNFRNKLFNQENNKPLD